MAADLPPLEYNLTGVPNVSLPGGGVNAADPGAQAEQIFRQNALRRAAALRANGVTPEMLARANSFGTAAPSVPLTENAAPVATADAAAAPSFSARAAAAAEGGIGRAGLLRGLLGRLGVYGGALEGGYEAGKILTPAPVAVGLADAVGTIAKKLGFDNSYAGGSAQYGAADARGDMTPGAPPAAAVPVAASVAAPAAAPAPVTNPAITPLSGDATDAANRLFFNGSAVPADGTGYIRNQNTGAITALDSRNAPQRVTRYTGTPATPAVSDIQAPTLGTNGGIFENLTDFANRYGASAISAANANRSAKLGIQQGTLAYKTADSAANRQAQATSAEGTQLRGYAAMLKALTDRDKPDVKVTTGMDGVPIITNLSTGKSTASVPAKTPTWEAFRDAAKADPGNRGFSEDQLKAYYNRTYGG